MWIITFIVGYIMGTIITIVGKSDFGGGGDD